MLPLLLKPSRDYEGGIIRTGFDETLDKYRRVLREGLARLPEIEAKERENSPGIQHA